jgi:NAD(P)-dependent dehydrogenase (short-subunit alcohol dehydrogenase family)
VPDGLDGLRAVVTGGGRGVGRAVAMALARAGADLAIVSRTAAEIDRGAEEIRALGRRALGLTADVTRGDQVAALAEQTVSDLGDVDILVNAAGEAASAPAVKTDEALWRRMIASNLDSVFFCTSAFLPGMLARRRGRIITIASRAGLQGFAYVSAYCAAKHGVVGFTRAVALEVAGTGVTINAVCPGYVDTEMTARSARRIADLTGISEQEARARLAAFNPQGRLISPEEVAAAVLDLARPGDGVNGEAIPL